jgi:hypothetical protein
MLRILAAVLKMEKYLKSTFFIDCDTSSIKEKAQQVTEGRRQDVAKAKSFPLFET